MVHPAAVSAAGAADAPAPVRPSGVRPYRLASGSFHAGDVFPCFDGRDRRASQASSTAAAAAAAAPLGRRTSSTPKYHTFPTIAPDDGSGGSGGSGDSGASSPGSGASSRQRRRRGRHTHAHAHAHAHAPTPPPTPLPLRQLALLALLSLAEQTALNSISPYLPTMVEHFDEIAEDEMGLYVGLLASIFALAQLATNLFWGYLSDAIGRKPVMLLGALLLMVCFCFFGFCTAYWQIVVVHVAMGLLNGNAAVVPTCLGEVTDRSNQSSAFTWLPIVYSLGSVTGPAVGGLLVGDLAGPYPFLAPNVTSAVLLGLAVVVLGLYFDETLDPHDRRALPARLRWMDTLWQRLCAWGTATEPGTPAEAGAASPLLGRNGDGSRGDSETTSTTVAGDAGGGGDSTPAEATGDDVPPPPSSLRQLLNAKTVVLLSTYLVFQLANIGFNSLYPIFSAAPRPTGRNLPPDEIGLLLSFAGAATMVFQGTVFQPLKTRLGNLGSYRSALFGLALSMLLMPWVCSGDDGGGGRPPLGVGSKAGWLDAEMAVVLVLKNICAIGGLSSVMLLINNSCPSNETLGTLNGVAQTLSAAGRSVGPFLSGALFSVSTRIRPRGELLAWCVFGGISGLGWLLSLLVNGRGLESADWKGAEGEGEGDGEGEGEDGDGADEDEVAVEEAGGDQW